MKTNIRKISAALLAVGICAVGTTVRAQETTTVTTTRGAFTKFVPASKTVVVRSETNPAPLRYSVTRRTTIVNQAGTPISLDQIPPGSPLSVEYTGTGDNLVASRIVVQRTPVMERRMTTTTTTTRTLTHEEKEALEEQREHRKERMKERIEREKEALEKAKDQLDDDDD
jgi:hypothetical protein